MTQPHLLRSLCRLVALIPWTLGLLMLGSCAHGWASTDDSRSIDVGGMERTYRLFVPSSYRKGTPTPLIVGMHGGLGTGKVFAEQSGLDAVAERRGFIVVYPDGYKRGWNAGTCCGGPMDKKIDDVRFIREVVEATSREFSIDRKRVYGTGFSNGAMLAYRVSCEAPDLFAAIAPVSGGLMTPACETTKSVSVLHIGGALDKNIPWNGGVYDGTYRRSAKQLVDLMSRRGNCGEPEKVLDSGTGFECRTKTSCSSGVEVSWCRLESVGHQWAGGKTIMPRLLGPNTESFSAAERVGDFFSRLTPGAAR